MVNSEETQWYALVRFGELNRGNFPDPFNSLTATQQDIVSLDVTYRKAFRFGQVSVGLGIESVEDEFSSSSDEDIRGFVQWRSSY